MLFFSFTLPYEKSIVKIKNCLKKFNSLNQHNEFPLIGTLVKLSYCSGKFLELKKYIHLLFQLKNYLYFLIVFIPSAIKCALKS